MKEITGKQVNNETKEEDPNMIYEDDTVQEIVKEVVEDEGSESDSEEEMTVSVIKYYGKEYYIVEGESPQYIYAIENGELGEKKGEMKDGKKVMYKKN